MKTQAACLSLALAWSSAAFAQSAAPTARSAAAAPHAAPTAQPVPAAQPAPAPTSPTSSPAPASPPGAEASPPAPASPAGSETSSPTTEVEPAPPASPAEPTPAPVASEPVVTEPVPVATAADTTPKADNYVDGWIIGGASWDLSVPLGSSTDFTGNVSAAGFSLEARYIGFGQLSFGLLVSSHFMTEKDETTTTQGPVTLSGTQIRTLATTPWFGRVHFSLVDVRKPSAQKRPVPYAAFGLGGARAYRELDMGISGFSKESWHWAMAPELGVQLPVNRAVFSLSTRLNYFFSSGDGPEQMYLNVSLGASFF